MFFYKSISPKHLMERKTQYYPYFLIILLFLIVNTSVFAQLSPLVSVYYQNQYLANPAFSGYQKGLNVNANYKHDLVGESGTSVNNTLTLDYQYNKMGFGLNVSMDKDGLINANRYLASYAYHLNISEGKALHFGLSAGITTENLNMGAIIGDMDDDLVMQYNNQMQPSFDADFGLAYTDKNLTAQFTIPNMRSILQKQDVDRIYTPTTFFSAISYKFDGKAGHIEPKIVYRGLRNYDSVLDAGVNLSTPTNNFNALLMYHSSNNATLGFGFTFQQNYQFQLAYSTPTVSTLRQYSPGNFQVGLKLHFLQN